MSDPAALFDFADFAAPVAAVALPGGVAYGFTLERHDAATFLAAHRAALRHEREHEREHERAVLAHPRSARMWSTTPTLDAYHPERDGHRLTILHATLAPGWAIDEHADRGYPACVGQIGPGGRLYRGLCSCGRFDLIEPRTGPIPVAWRAHLA